MYYSKLHMVVVILLIPALILAPMPGFAAGAFAPGSFAPPAANSRPVFAGSDSNTIVDEQVSRKLVRVVQDPNMDKVVLDWNSFNVSEDWTVNFEQGGSNKVAFNKINDISPSKIAGTVNADGKIILYNANGVMFGPSSKVNVHSLIATSLKVDDASFLTASDHIFTASADAGNVINYGTITAQQGGAVLLMAPNVANYGVVRGEAVETVAGQETQYQTGEIALAAVSSATVTDTFGFNKFSTDRKDAGTALNARGAVLVADAPLSTGGVGMYGNTVDQEGLIRSVTTVSNAGRIVLRATSVIDAYGNVSPGRIVLGESSQTVTPVSISSDTKYASVAHGMISILDADYVDIEGLVESPGGTINIGDGQGSLVSKPLGHVYIGPQALVSVAGVVSSKSADSQVLSTQLNSDELSDYYLQKGGVLQGTTINYLASTGTSIGDVSNALDATSQILTAVTGNAAGGTINIVADELVTQTGSVLDFSGGAIRYAEGYADTTKLLLGNKIYDISNAPSTYAYTAVLGDYERAWSRFGITDKWDGIYTKGGRIFTYVPSYTVGYDGGKLNLQVGKFILDGTILGAAYNDIYQNKQSDSSSSDKSVSIGRTKSIGGTITVGLAADVSKGTDQASTNDQVTDSIVVQQTPAKLASQFGAETSISENASDSYVSILSATSLMASGASAINLYANEHVDIASDVQLVLTGGSSFSAAASSITMAGSITIPQGTVSLSVVDTKAHYSSTNSETVTYSGYVPRLYIASTGSIDVSGEQVDNTQLASDSLVDKSFYLSGGTITLADYTWDSQYSSTDGTEYANGTARQGVIVREGASLKLNGGFRVDAGNKVTAGNAGTLSISGAAVVLDGLLEAKALLGKTGGSVSISAEHVTVAPSGTNLSGLPDGFSENSLLSAELRDNFYMTADRFDSTGFTRIALNGRQGLVVQPGVELTPSSIRSVRVIDTDAGVAVRDTMADEPNFGSSSITLTAGTPLSAKDNRIYPTAYATVVVAADASLEVSPGGSISLKGPQVDLYGRLTARAGTVNVTSTKEDLIIHSGAMIDVSGYNRAGTPVGNGLPTYTALDGGTVSLGATSSATDQLLRSLTIESGALIDLSGSDPVTSYITTADLTYLPVVKASNPGTLALTYGAGVEIADGTLRAQGKVEGLRGGTLSISGVYQTLDAPHALTVNIAQMQRFLQFGFDELSIKAAGTLVLDGSDGGVLTVGAKLTLDGQVITSTGQDVHLLAPWIVLANTFYANTNTSLQTGAASMAVDAEYIDIQGNVQLSTFGNVALNAQRDLRLYDYEYPALSSTVLAYWSGGLKVPGNLTLAASRIYPGTNVGSESKPFTIEVAQKLTVLPGAYGASGYIDSAGSYVSITAQDIDFRGTLLAPMGYISMEAGNRLMLSAGSLISTMGSDAVSYGELVNSRTQWVITDKTTNTEELVTAAPDSGITLKASTAVTDSNHPELAGLVVQSGATLNVSGDGSVYAYKYSDNPTLASIDPLTLANTYIIVPGVNLPGEKVHITGSSLVADGDYTLINAKSNPDYAFLSGAMILVDQGILSKDLALSGYKTKDGYSIVTGTLSEAGKAIGSGQVHGYSIRSASDVLAEADYGKQSYDAGAAGTLKLVASRAIIEGTLLAAAKTGYSTGALIFGGAESSIVQQAMGLANGFDFNSSAIGDSLYLSASNINNFAGTLTLGDKGVTKAITIAGGTTLSAGNIELVAADTITIGDGIAATLVQATGSDGYVSFNMAFDAPVGKAIIKNNSIVRTNSTFNINAADLDLDTAGGAVGGIFEGTGGRLNINSTKIYIMPVDYAGSKLAGLNLYSGLPGFRNFSELWLGASNSITLVGDAGFTLPVALGFDTPSIAWTGMGVAGRVNATVQSQSITLANSYGSTSTSATGLGSVTFTATGSSAGSFNVGQTKTGVAANISMTGFGSVTLASYGDLNFIGQGSVAVGNDLNVAAGRITLRPYVYAPASGSVSYENAAFTVSSAINLAVSSLGSASDAALTPGGALAMTAANINFAGNLRAVYADITLSAADTLTLASGGTISNTGSASTLGGLITLNGANIDFQSGALLDVSAGSLGYAGEIVVAGQNGTAANLLAFGGALQGAGSMRGGSLQLDVNSLDNLSSDTSGDAAANDFAVLASALTKGGFTGDQDLRFRTATSIVVGSSLKAQSVSIAVDAGSLTLTGSIDASGTRGGTVSLFARDNLTLAANSKIYAQATVAGEEGGYVLGKTSQGLLDFAAGATIAVGNTASATDIGTVMFQVDSNHKVVTWDGSISGAANKLLVVNSVYDVKPGANNTTTISSTSASIALVNGTSTTLSAMLKAANDAYSDGANYTTIGGVEIRSSGGLTFSSAIDLASSNVGVLTLRSAGNLTISKSIVDGNGHYNSITSKNAVMDSWGINLVAGADTSAANFMATGATASALTISGASVYTESAPIRFASSGNANIASPPSVSSTNAPAVSGLTKLTYNIGTFDGDISGNVRGKLTLTGAIQSAYGDIDITAGSLYLGSETSAAAPGSIRTTGYVPDTSISTSAYYAYAGGGDIALNIRGNIQSSLSALNWAASLTTSTSYGGSMWGASYATTGYTTAGVATMGGGSIFVQAGGDVEGQYGTFGLNAYDQTGTPTPSLADGNTGNLSIYTQGDLDGQFLIRHGTANLVTMDDFGTLTSRNTGVTRYANQSVEMFGAQLNILAQGNLQLGFIGNPSLFNENILSSTLFGSAYRQRYEYTDFASAALSTAYGDISYTTGTSSFYTSTGTLGGKILNNLVVLPPSLTIASGRDVVLQSNILMGPSDTGELSITAARNIDSGTTSSRITMSDTTFDGLFGKIAADTANIPYQVASLPSKFYDYDLIHMQDSTPVYITAGGDITDLSVYMPKATILSAGGTITNLDWNVQNLHDDDLSLIQAGKSFYLNDLYNLSSDTPVKASSIDQYGPGYLVIQAGDTIDLGVMTDTNGGLGVRTLGRGSGSALRSAFTSSQGASLTLIAGYSPAVTPQQLLTLFSNPNTPELDSLQELGSDYSAHPANKDADLALATALIDKFLGSPTGTGKITMLSSQITTSGANSDITLVAAGAINLGDATAAKASATSTGVSTLFGGNINVFARGDVDVYASKISTAYGGDIVIWSDDGNVNAGRGSKTAISASDVEIRDEFGNLVGYGAPSVGSGIRTVTFDPDGSGPMEAPAQGNISVFAPRGTIDAGEAGISGNNVTLAALQVLNVQNITVSGVSSGVPTQVSTGVSLGALSGTNTLNNLGSVVDAAVGAQSAQQSQKAAAAAQAQELVSKILDVKVLEYLQ